MKETLAIMSLGRFSYMMANIATEFCFTAFSSLVFFYGYMIPMWVVPVYEDSVLFQKYPWVLLLAMSLNGFSLVSLSLLISSFLRDSKVASQIGMFVVYLPCSIFLALFITVTILSLDVKSGNLDDYWGTTVFQVGYVLPHFSFGIVFLEFLTKGGATLLGYNVALAWISLVLQTPLYLLLHVYFDAIIPNNFGISQKCCFCLKRSANRQQQNIEEQ